MKRIIFAAIAALITVPAAADIQSGDGDLYASVIHDVGKPASDNKDNLPKGSGDLYASVIFDSGVSATDDKSGLQPGFGDSYGSVIFDAK